jgi:hypothetical protein
MKVIKKLSKLTIFLLSTNFEWGKEFVVDCSPRYTVNYFVCGMLEIWIWGCFCNNPRGRWSNLEQPIKEFLGQTSFFLCHNAG